MICGFAFRSIIVLSRLTTLLSKDAGISATFLAPPLKIASQNSRFLNAFITEKEAKDLYLKKPQKRYLAKKHAEPAVVQPEKDCTTKPANSSANHSDNIRTLNLWYTGQEL